MDSQVLSHRAYRDFGRVQDGHVTFLSKLVALVLMNVTTS